VWERDVSPLFAQVPVSYWATARREGWTGDECLLGIYLLSSPHRNLEGFYRLPAAYAADDVAWTAGRVRDALDRLVARDYIAYDNESSVVLVVDGLSHYCPKGEKQIIGALNSLRGVPSTHLIERLIESAEKHGPEFAIKLRKAYPATADTPPKGYPPGLDTPSATGGSIGEVETEVEIENSSSPVGAETEIREDIDRLCLLLAELMRGNDVNTRVRPTSKTWRDAMRLLVDRDGRDLAEIERVIRWSQADEFWRSNVLSPGKLREKFSQLLLKSQSEAPAGLTTVASSRTDLAYLDDGVMSAGYDEDNRGGAVDPDYVRDLLATDRTAA
jgi:hypothetical protein